MGYVYVIGIEGSHLLKIGKCVAEPAKRLRILQIGTPFLLNLLKYYPCENQDSIEIRMHRLLRNRRHTGEWFDATIDEIDLIYQQANDQFNNQPASEFQYFSCIKCEMILPIDGFVVLSSGNRGNVCKTCREAQHRKWRKDNHIKLLDIHKNYRQNNREKRSAYQKEYRASRIEYYREYSREYAKRRKQKTVSSGQGVLPL